VPAYLLPSLHDALAQNRPAELLTLAVAGWFRYTCAPSTSTVRPLPW
jgi:mannitol-1-phosphate/altronate dehydrogenase